MTHWQSWLALVTLFSAAVPASACSFCGDGFARRQPLRGHFAEAKVVVFGHLKDPKPGADGISGTTQFVVAQTLKNPGTVAPPAVLTIARYLPVLGDTPTGYLFFCSIVDGKIEPSYGTPANEAVVEHLARSSKFVGHPPEALAYFFEQLSSRDPAVSNDAFVEFARASDGDLTAARGRLNRQLVREWIADPNTPDERIGVFGLLLGLTGTKTDADWLHVALAAEKPTERVLTNFGGLLTGLTLLDPTRGWAIAEQVLTTPNRSFSDQLNVIAMVRYFQQTKPGDSRGFILKCYRNVIDTGDLADVVIDDLRRWGWWDHTAVVLGCFGQPKYRSPAMKRGIVRYALQCPDEAAKRFIAGLRQTDAKLVEQAETGLKLAAGK